MTEKELELIGLIKKGKEPAQLLVIAITAISECLRQNEQPEQPYLAALVLEGEKEK